MYTAEDEPIVMRDDHTKTKHEENTYTEGTSTVESILSHSLLSSTPCTSGMDWPQLLDTYI